MFKIQKIEPIKAPFLFFRESGLSLFKLKAEGVSKTTRKVIVLLICFLSFLQSNAQCAMCRAVLESEEGQSTAEGVNNGIVYLMSIPYILVGGIGFVIYWKFFRNKKV